MNYYAILFLFELIFTHQALGQNLTGRADVCYGALGCFTTSGPFGVSIARPVSLLPQAPEVVDTIFYLYTRSNQEH